MYCPSCGSNNQAEVKFCTRCGTNLAVVSDALSLLRLSKPQGQKGGTKLALSADALSGKPADQSPLDERMVNLFKNYYGGRNSVLIGSIACALVLSKVILFALVSFPNIPGFVGVLTTLLLIYGLIALVWGIGAWSNSASEIKAIERAASVGTALRSAEARPGLLASEPVNIANEAPVTDPLAYPGSVTEPTTRQLEEKVYKSSIEDPSKQSQ